jgi:hypothetical protein
MEAVKIFKYNETPVTFKLGDTTMVNATEMAKPFGKRPAKWLELPSTKEFLSTLTTIRFSDSEKYVLTINGGTTENGKGTWFHEDVALEFARWLSPAFAIWCNDRIKELLRTCTTGRYDTSCNIIPGVHSPQAAMIGEHSIWTICLEDVLYYRLKDIMNATGIYEHKRKETSKDWFRPYIYWINDQTGTVPHRYVKEPGILFLISRTRATKGNAGAQQFLRSFTRQAEKNRRTKILPENLRQEGTDRRIDLKKFLDVIISIHDDETRNFLYNLYKKLGGESDMNL